MKKLIELLITSNRKTLLLASTLLSLAAFGVVAWQSKAQSNSNETGDGIIQSPSSPLAGTLLISEFRLRGPNGANDEFIEIYNNSGAPHTVAAVSGTGYGIAASDGVLRCTIPNANRHSDERAFSLYKFGRLYL